MALRRFSLLAIVTLSLSSGCSYPPIPVLYTAQNSIRAHDGLETGIFRYLPADQGHLRPNELEHTATGPLFLDTDVAKYVKRAFALELDRSGYSAAAPRISMDCEISRLKADDLGFTVDWYLEMGCRFRRLDTGTLVASADATVKKLKCSKTGGLEITQRYLNGLLLEAYEQVFAPEVRSRFAVDR